jgi:hypothetical protein
MAVLLSWIGGRAISEFGQTDHFFAELEGIGLTAICGGIGLVAKEAGERLLESDEQVGQRLLWPNLKLYFTCLY